MINELGQPVGDLVPEWSARPLSTVSTVSGRYCRLERLADRHAEELFRCGWARRAGRVVDLPGVRTVFWYSIIDSEWPVVESRLCSWLAPENFDERAVQKAPFTSSP